MKVKEIVKNLHLQVAAGQKGLEHDVEDGYCGDLLSDVMANAPKGAVWITVQGHQNIVAVAVLRELAAIILVNGRIPDEDTKTKADNEEIPILVSELPAFSLASRLYEIGISTKKE